MKTRRIMLAAGAVFALALLGTSPREAEAGGSRFRATFRTPYGRLHIGSRPYRHSGRFYREHRRLERRYYRRTPHLDYYPGGFYRHRSHYHYVPGHYHWHRGRH